MPRRRKRDFADIIFEILEKPKEEEYLYLEEGVIPLTPFVAFAAFKNKVFNALRRNKLFQDLVKAKKAPSELKAKAQITKEKLRAGIGLQTKGTVYKLTQEQVKILSDIYSKYGKKLSDDILEFRRNVLAPYQVIKRNIKQSSVVGSKDIFGMTREEFRSALESGRKKIQARGEKFFDKSNNLRKKLNEISERIKALRSAKNSLKGDNPKIDYNIMGKVYKTFDIPEGNIEGYSKEELRKVYEEIMKNYRSLLKIKDVEDMGQEEFERAKSIMNRQRRAWAGKTIDLTKREKEDFYKVGSFNSALGKYFFSREILRQLLSPRTVNIFKTTYSSIIDEMVKKSNNERKKLLQELITLKKSTELDEREKRIWDRRPTVKSFSSNLEDYYQKVKEGDFLEKSINIPRTPKLIQAEREIENQVKKFERKLAKIVTAEDLGKLKKYRLINNLITIKELKDPGKLFKSRAELEKMAAESEGEIKDKEKKTFMSPPEYHRRLKEIATTEYDKISELNTAKQEAEELTQVMKDQGDEKAVKDYADILRQIRLRRTPETKKLVGQELEPSHLIDIDDVESLAKELLKKEYTSVDKVKQDKSRLERMIERYKKEGGEEAERNINEIEFLINRIDRKLQRELSGLK